MSEIPFSPSSMFVKNRLPTVGSSRPVFVPLSERSLTKPSIETVIERDPDVLSRVKKCMSLEQNPYISLIRFDKITKYKVVRDYIPNYVNHRYKPMGNAHGMSAGPYGVTVHNNELVALKPTVLIIDSSYIWRNKYGEQLRGKSIASAKNEFFDFFDRSLFNRASVNKFGYRVPTLDLVDLVGLKKVPDHLDPLIAAGVVGFMALMLPRVLDKRKSHLESGLSGSRSSGSRSRALDRSSCSECESDGGIGQKENQCTDDSRVSVT